MASTNMTQDGKYHVCVQDRCLVSSTLHTNSTMPIVFVCGWMNGKERPAQKYAQLYERLGYRTIILLSKGSDFFIPNSWVHQSSWKALTDTLKHEQSKVIVHVMSNGGCRSWYCFERQAQMDGVEFEIVSMVFDSCPSLPTKDRSRSTSAYGADAKSETRKNASKFFASCAIILYRCLGIIFGFHHPFRYPFERMIIQQAAVPKLFLYSKSDTLVGYEEIEYTMSKAKELNTTISCYDFGNSKHIAHMMQDPETYKKIVDEFITKYS